TRRTPHRAASRQSAARFRARQRGSSPDVLSVEECRQVDRMALQLLEKNEEAVVGHALRIEDAVEVVAFMLHDPGMKPRRLALEHGAVEAVPAIADVEIARNDAAQPGNRQAPFPAERALGPDRL